MTLTSTTTPVPPAEPRPPRRRAVLAVAGVALVALVAVGALVRAATADHPRAATVTVTAAAEPTILLTAGQASLVSVRDHLPAGQRRLVATAADGSVTLAAHLVVGAGAHLRIDRATVRLLDTGAGSATLTVAAGGRLELRRSTVVSWLGAGPDLQPADGRASISAAGAGAVLRVDHSQLDYLGSSADSPGVRWGPGSTGSARDSTCTGNVVGMEVDGAHDVALTDDTVTRSTADGVVVHAAPGAVVRGLHTDGNALDGLGVRSSPGARLMDVEAAGNGGNGLAVSDSDAVVIDVATLHWDAIAGLSVTGGSGLAVTDTTVYAEPVGLAVSNASGSVRHSQLSGNVTAGAQVSVGGTMRFDDVRFDHDTIAGLSVLAGTVSVTGGRFDQNGTGLRVLSPRPALSVTASAFTANVKDAIALTALTGLHISGNTISGTGDAVVSLAAKADVGAILRANTVARGQTPTRVRVS